MKGGALIGPHHSMCAMCVQLAVWEGKLADVRRDLPLETNQAQHVCEEEEAREATLKLKARILATQESLSEEDLAAHLTPEVRQGLGLWNSPLIPFLLRCIVVCGCIWAWNEDEKEL